MSFNGGKGGTFRHIINRMPPHDRYIETHLGGGAIMLNKNPSHTNIGIDIDPEIVERWRNQWEKHKNGTGRLIIKGDCVDWLHDQYLPPKTLIYSDPPYMFECRKSSRKLYNYEYSTEDHERLLKCLKSLSSMVMISGYSCLLYENELKNWTKITYNAPTRRGGVPECLWMNFPEPEVLHEYTWLGKDRRQRERIKKKISRFKSKLKRLSVLERNAILEALNGDLG